MILQPNPLTHVVQRFFIPPLTTHNYLQLVHFHFLSDSKMEGKHITAYHPGFILSCHTVQPLIKCE